MNKKLKYVLGGAAALFVVVTAVGFVLPSQMEVQRSVVINAPPDRIYPLINSFESGWSQWNPFTKPGMDMSYEGPEAGVGAQQHWVDKESDEDGSMTITRSDPQRGVEFDLVMMQESFRLTGSLLCEPAGEGTKLTWTDRMDLGNNPYSRYMGLVLGPMIGSEFEVGLQSIKDLAEAPAPQVAAR